MYCYGVGVVAMGRHLGVEICGAGGTNGGLGGTYGGLWGVGTPRGHLGTQRGHAHCAAMGWGAGEGEMWGAEGTRGAQHRGVEGTPGELPPPVLKWGSVGGVGGGPYGALGGDKWGTGGELWGGGALVGQSPSPETQSCMLSASNTLHSSVQRVSAVGMEDSVPEGGGAWGRSGGRGQHGATPTREKPRPLLLSHAPPIKFHP